MRSLLQTLLTLAPPGASSQDIWQARVSFVGYFPTGSPSCAGTCRGLHPSARARGGGEGP